MIHRLGLVLLVLPGLAFGAAAPPAARKTATRPASPDSFASLAARAAAARESDRTDEAVNLYRRALALRPAWAEGWWRLGTLHYDRDRYAEAGDAFAHFVQAEPKAGPGLAMLGLCEFQLKRYDRAFAALARGRRLGLGGNQDLSRVVRYHSAIIATRLGMPEVALSYLDLLVAEDANRGIAPETPPMMDAFGLAGLCRRLLPSEIPENMRGLVRMAGRARLYIAVKKRPEALDLLKDLTAAYPGEPGVHYLRGSVLLYDNAEGAIEEFERELKVAPDDVASQLQIAFGRLGAGEYESGLPYAEQAVKLAPSNFAAHTVLGRLLLGLDQTKRAIPALEAGVKLAPSSPEARFALAQGYAQAGRAKDAERERVEFRRLRTLSESATMDTGIPLNEVRP